MQEMKKIIYQAERATTLSEFNEKQQSALRRLIEICREAVASGNNPFGCLLVDRNDNILMEQGNCEAEHKGDCTGHAETELMRRASMRYSKEKLAECMMYTSNEPCAMCAGAIYWSGLGGVAYISSESALRKLTGNDPRNPTLDLPCRAVFACGQRSGIRVIGPIPELEEDLLVLHRQFWKP